MSARYDSFGRHLRTTFARRIFKIPIDAGFTCPNIDGTVARGGCSFCDNRSFAPNARGAPRSIEDQLQSGMARYRRRFRAEGFIAYFQAFTNTHAPVERLRVLYDRALALPDVVGLAIATRPDCVPEPVLELLGEYHRRTYLWLEYGLQTIHDATLAALNRWHTYAQFVDAVTRARARGLRLSAHLILGLPGETRAMMLASAAAVAQLALDGVKIHHLYLSPNTALEQQHRRTPLALLALPDYVALVCDVLERLPPRMVIERLMGELDGPYVAAPRWGESKARITARIEAELLRRGTRQGSLYPPTPGVAVEAAQPG